VLLKAVDLHLGYCVLLSEGAAAYHIEAVVFGRKTFIVVRGVLRLLVVGLHANELVILRIALDGDLTCGLLTLLATAIWHDRTFAMVHRD
jgi:hypothetical protein